MAQNSRVSKSLLNARVNVICYLLVLVVMFFSRKMFLGLLGSEFVGLSSTLYNMLSMLNIAEMGVGSAIVYVLYKPLAEGNKDKVCQVVSVVGYIYSRIGMVIAGAAVVLSFFLPLIFADTPFSWGVIYFAFFSLLSSSMLSYFANYKQLLLTADQRNYTVTAYFQGSNILRLCCQMAVTYYTRNLYLWIALEITFGIIYSVLLNRSVRRSYPWLQTSLRQGKSLFKQYPEVVRYTKQIFVHKIGGIAMLNIVPLIIYAYTSLSMVAFYTNYTIVCDKISQLVSQLMGSAQGGIGNLVATGHPSGVRKVYWELTSTYYLIAGTVLVSLLCLIDPFITLWVGEQYILPRATLYLILANVFVQMTRLSNDTFIFTHGLFYDTWAPLTEAGLNIGCSILLGSIYGLNGILVGSLISQVLIVGIWKPYFLFSKGFGQSVWIYWRKIAVNIGLIVVMACVVLWGRHFVTIDPTMSYWAWVRYGAVIFLSGGVLLWGVMWCFVQGMRDMTGRLVEIVRCKFRGNR